MSVGLPIAHLATIPASKARGGLVAGTFWIAVGALLATGSLASRQAPVRAAAAA